MTAFERSASVTRPQLTLARDCSMQVSLPAIMLTCLGYAAVGSGGPQSISVSPKTVCNPPVQGAMPSYDRDPLLLPQAGTRQQHWPLLRACLESRSRMLRPSKQGISQVWTGIDFSPNKISSAVLQLWPKGALTRWCASRPVEVFRAWCHGFDAVAF